MQDVSTFHRSLGKTKALNNSCNRFVYHFYPQSILVLEEYLPNCNRNSHLHNCKRKKKKKKETSKIHQHTSNRKYHLKTYKNATDVATCIIAIECVSCIVPTETVTCRTDYRNFPLQKWCQSEIFLVIIKKSSKRVSTNFKENSFSTPCIT